MTSEQELVIPEKVKVGRNVSKALQIRKNARDNGIDDYFLREFSTARGLRNSILGAIAPMSFYWMEITDGAPGTGDKLILGLMVTSMIVATEAVDSMVVSYADQVVEHRNVEVELIDTEPEPSQPTAIEELGKIHRLANFMLGRSLDEAA